MSLEKKSKLLAVLFLVFALLLASCSNDDASEELDLEMSKSDFRAGGNKSSWQKSGDLAAYTYMVYMNGSDLESEDLAGAATLDILEMAEVGSNEALNVVIETGGTLAWANDIIDPEQNQRWLVVEEDLEHLADLGLRNMGDPATLTDFIIWSVENYPAEKYVLNFWNHGSGPIYGYGADEHHDSDSLTLPEIQKALADAYDATGVTFEIIAFDTCLMATVETAYIVQPFANYLVASEELEPGHGWNYTPILSAIVDYPEITGDELGKIIADEFMKHAEDNDTADGITLSVTDLSKIDAIIEALEAFVSVAAPSIEQQEHLNIISKGRSRTETYGGNDDHSGYTDIIDLAHFAKNVSGVFSEAEDLIAAVEDAVIYKVNGPTRQFGNGLSIYFPYDDKEYFEENLAMYEQIDFSASYQAFVREYAEMLLSDTTGIRLVESNPEHADEDSVYSIVISEEDIDSIEHIYMFLGMFLDDDEEEVLNLGMDNDVYFDPDTGVVSDNFSGWWVGLNGSFISLNIIEETELYNRYTIPVFLNGKEVVLLASWFWDDDYEAGGYYKLHGAWRGIDDQTNVADKNIIKIKRGDIIIPILEHYTIETGEEGWIEGDEIIVEDTLELTDMELPLGNYLYGFYLTDFAGNEVYSEYAIIELVE